MNGFLCPFCGKAGKRTKEHVWAQWLHETEGAKFLLGDPKSQRIPKPSHVMRKGTDGRYRLVGERRGEYAKFLPQVIVSVCQDCNTGWMSQLESRVKDTIEPFVLGGGQLLTLSEDDLVALATWAPKSWMAYALTRPTQNNPFAESEYRALAADPQPLERGHVWLLNTTGPRSHVGMAIAPTLFAREPPDLELAPDNAAYGFLTVAGMTMFLVLLPPEAPSPFELIFTPPQLRRRGTRRIWPNPRRQYFPIEPWSAADLSSLLDLSWLSVAVWAILVAVVRGFGLLGGTNRVSWGR